MLEPRMREQLAGGMAISFGRAHLHDYLHVHEGMRKSITHEKKADNGRT